jgi:hypothetical protein
MTEQEWAECTDSTPMLEFLRGKASDRKLRLFAVGCCCRILRLVTDQRSVNAVLVADRYIDGAASLDELKEAALEARRAYENAFQTNDNAAQSVVYLASDGQDAAALAAAYAGHAVGHELAAAHRSEYDENYAAGAANEQKAQAALLRHIIGNPFRPYPAPPSWPPTVVQLAESLYAGQDCAFALHDALLEAGHAELAEHFREEKSHPKGCWVVDLILGKK